MKALLWAILLTALSVHATEESYSDFEAMDSLESIESDNSAADTYEASIEEDSSKTEEERMDSDTVEASGTTEELPSTQENLSDTQITSEPEKELESTMAKDPLSTPSQSLTSPSPDKEEDISEETSQNLMGEQESGDITSDLSDANVANPDRYSMFQPDATTPTMLNTNDTSGTSQLGSATMF